MKSENGVYFDRVRLREAGARFVRESERQPACADQVKKRTEIPGWIRAVASVLFSYFSAASQTLLFAFAVVLAAMIFSGDNEEAFNLFLHSTGQPAGLMLQLFAAAGLWVGWGSMSSWKLWLGRAVAGCSLWFFWSCSVFPYFQLNEMLTVLVGCVVAYCLLETGGYAIRKALPSLQSGDKIAAAYGLSSLPVGVASVLLMYLCATQGGTAGAAISYGIPNVTQHALIAFVSIFLPTFMAVRSTTCVEEAPGIALAVTLQSPVILGLLFTPVCAGILFALGHGGEAAFQIEHLCVSAWGNFTGVFVPLIMTIGLITLSAMLAATAATHFNRRAKVKFLKSANSDVEVGLRRSSIEKQAMNAKVAVLAGKMFYIAGVFCTVFLAMTALEAVRLQLQTALSQSFSRVEEGIRGPTM